MKHQINYLKDYQPSNFLLDEVFLYFELTESLTTVKSKLLIKRNPDALEKNAPLVLHGEDLKLNKIILDAKALADKDYAVSDKELTIKNVPDSFALEIVVEIHPENNTQLKGLYQSDQCFCTQCEPHGFRRITYFIDRPDVLTKFTVSIIANKTKYPTLLSNGNLIEQRDLEDGKHLVIWQDPWPKSCYLFALVAGDFDVVSDYFVTFLGKKVLINVYVEKGHVDQAHYAMQSIKRAMRWDEEVYSREYDLQVFNVVAVSFFNSGAMENKGLNIFNTKYILAKSDIATDQDYINVESVIGHEYFHNWSGDRVTCRDWFQLSLKEGLTVFRDQSFTADMHSEAVKRIWDADFIQTTQFAQDASPLAHPVRPESYIEMNNFYTVTVYHKGAEVIRMMQTILGKKNFLKAMNEYFSRFDGRAVTIDDFINVMQDVSGIDLSQFRLWYSQAGTPILSIDDDYDAAQQRYVLRVKQSCPPTPEQPAKQPMHIPLAVGLLDETGQDMVLAAEETTRVLQVKAAAEKFVFENIASKPVISLLRDFSAPVKVEYPYSDGDLLFLMAHDSDPYSRWFAARKLVSKVMLNLIQDHQNGKQLVFFKDLLAVYREILFDDSLDKAFRSLLLTLPNEEYLLIQMTVADVDAVHFVSEFVRRAIGTELHDDLLKAYHANHRLTNAADADIINERMLKNTCLNYLVYSDEFALAEQQFVTAQCMTDTMAAIMALIHFDSELKERLLQQFYNKWQHESLVVDKWFRMQAIGQLPGSVERVRQLTKHAKFDEKNPDKVRALISAFARENNTGFHDKTGGGYELVADYVIELDKINPQIASRLLEMFASWRKHDKVRQNLAKQQLQRILREKDLSNNVYEIANKLLKNG